MARLKIGQFVCEVLEEEVTSTRVQHVKAILQVSFSDVN